MNRKHIAGRCIQVVGCCCCRLAYPEEDWLHLVGLIHDLGKLLAHRE